MAYKNVFRRFELKYMITTEQKEVILSAMEPYMQPDKYPKSTVRNIYFDTDTYRLIRRSIEKPAYKEKLRMRSYIKADSESTVFVELKKKYDHIVYKRRLSLSEKDAVGWICRGEPIGTKCQISDEIDYFMFYYETLHPTVFLSYEREAFTARDKSDLRITFDENILCRTDELILESEVYGELILPEGQVLMEIKTSDAMPLWLAHLLSENRIYRTSFSKYGTAYEKIIFRKKDGNNNA